MWEKVELEREGLIPKEKTENEDDIVFDSKLLENDDDKIFKWYSGIGHKDLLPSNNVSKLLKDFKIK